MRQSFIVLFIFCTFLFVIGYFPIDFTNKLMPERFIHDEVVIVNKNFKFLERVQDFKETPLAETLLNIDYSLISKVLNLPDFDAAQVKEWQETFQSMIAHPLAIELFSREFTIALFANENNFNVDRDYDLFSNLLIIARPRHHARIIEIFSDLIDSEDTVTEARYGGYVIKRIPLENNQAVAVARVKDLLVISLNERILRKSLDVYDRNSSLISEVKDYSKAMKKFQNCSSLTYVNVKKAIAAIHNSIQQEGSEDLSSDVIEKLKKFNAYKHLIWGTWDNKSSLSHRAIVRFNRDEILPEYRELFRIKPSKSDIYKRINADTIWYYWTNILKPKALLTLYNHGIPEAEENGSSIIEEIAASAGLTAEELFSLVGNDFLVAVKNSPEEQFIPIPHLLFALKTSNPEKLLRVIETVTEYYDIPLTKQSIGGKNLYLWGGVIPTGDLQPAFCISDNYLILSSNRQQIKEFTLAEKDYRSLASNPYFREVEDGLTADNNSINYIDSKNLTVLIKEVFSWIGTMIAIQDREAAQRSKILIDKLINPLLDGLAMYSTIGMRSYREKDSIIIESKILKNYGKE